MIKYIFIEFSVEVLLIFFVILVLLFLLPLFYGVISLERWHTKAGLKIGRYFAISLTFLWMAFSLLSFYYLIQNITETLKICLSILGIWVSFVLTIFFGNIAVHKK